MSSVECTDDAQSERLIRTLNSRLSTLNLFHFCASSIFVSAVKFTTVSATSPMNGPVGNSKKSPGGFLVPLSADICSNCVYVS